MANSAARGDEPGGHPDFDSESSEKLKPARGCALGCALGIGFWIGVFVTAWLIGSAAHSAAPQ
jgi:hypothetical protein